RRTTYLPSSRERPICIIRPSCTATTAAFGALITSTSRSVCVATPGAPVAAAAAAAGGSGAVEPGVTDTEWARGASPEGAFACALELAEEATRDDAPHATCLPVTGSPA